MTAFPVQVNAWQRDPGTSFEGTQISESILVDPRGQPTNPAAYAAIIHQTALARRAQGQRVVLRPWFPFNIGAEPFAYHAPKNDALHPNAWPQQVPAFQGVTLPAAVTSWWDTFFNELRNQGTVIDEIMIDDERQLTYWYLDGQSHRETYFTPVTAPGFTHPALGETNPFVGKNVWSLSSPDADPFIQIYEQWAAEEKAANWRRLIQNAWTTAQKQAFQTAYETRFGELPEGQSFNPEPAHNYKDAKFTFPIRNRSNKPLRYPPPEARIGAASAVVAYRNRETHDLFAPRPEDVTPRQIANTQRWKSIIWSMNQVRSAAGSEPGYVHPWTESPGWGWDGADAYANATQLPFELLLFRVVNGHFEAMGVDRYNWWGPIPSTPGTNDPNTATTHPFVAAYYTGRMVGPLLRDLPEIPIDALSITTNGVTTHFEDLFERSVVYYRREGTQTVPFLFGTGTLADPLVVSNGAAGDTEVARMVAAFQNNQGTAVAAVEVTAMAPQTFRNQYPKAPVVKVNLYQGDRFVGGGRIDPVEGGTLVNPVVRAQVRARGRGSLIHDFAPEGSPLTLTPDGDGVTYLLDTADTDAWPAGVLLCDVEVTTDGAGPVIVTRYEIEVRETVTQ